jgi:uncharacterized protein (DUF1330 family)
MAAYIIGSVTGVSDQARTEEYGGRIEATMAPYGGKFLVRGPGECIEGKWEHLAAAIIEFPSMDALKEWYDSAAYRELRTLRKGALDADMLVANGV